MVLGGWLLDFSRIVLLKRNQRKSEEIKGNTVLAMTNLNLAMIVGNRVGGATSRILNSLPLVCGPSGYWLLLLLSEVIRMPRAVNCWLDSRLGSFQYMRRSSSLLKVSYEA